MTSNSPGQNTSVRARLVPLDLVEEQDRSHLTVAEIGRHIPFPVKRAFYYTGLREGEVRGKHAHHSLEEFIICITGRARVLTEDGQGQQQFGLDGGPAGVYIPPMTWISVEISHPNTNCVVFASAPYDDADYIRDIDSFRKILNEQPA